MQNIHLYIGDNASGKTRTLRTVIQDAQTRDLAIVTNIAQYALSAYATNPVKLSRIKKVNNELTHRLFQSESYTYQDNMIRNILGLFSAEGDILVIDELDKCLTDQDIIHVCMILSEIRDCWREIHISGYSEHLLRMFTFVDTENLTEHTEYNVYYTDASGVAQLKESDIIEYINTIRG